jgi:Na+-driven multidrug efflux pump
MLGMLIGAGVNTALDPLFIFVFRWGVEGAAWATIISQLLSAGWLLYFHGGKKMVLHLKPLTFIRETLSRIGGLRLRREMVFRIMAFGSAQFLLQFVMSGVQVIYNLSMTWYGPAGLGVPNGGEIGLAGMNIVGSITMLILMPVFGINQGAQPILGYNYGAKKYRRVLNAYLGAAGAATGICVLGFILVQIFAETIVRFFAPQGSPPLLAFTPWAMRIATLALPLNGFQIVSSNLYVVTGRPKLSIILSMLRQCILLIPFMLLFGFIWGLRGVVFSIPLVDGITFFIVGGMIFFELRKLRRSK